MHIHFASTEQENQLIEVCHVEVLLFIWTLYGNQMDLKYKYYFMQ
jgi:hypothetical protein